MSAAVASAGPLLEVDGLEKHFTLHVLDGRRLPAFAGVSFTLARGECLLLRGRSGTGKSSLLKCLYRTYRATGGCAVIRAPQGHADLVTVPDVEVLGLRRTVIGYVSQFFWAIPRVAAASVVAEPLLDLGVEPERARRAAREMLERFDVPRTLWECFPSTFSGGERQRVNLARALIASRDLLLLDEPTASLDAARAGLVMEVLEERKARGTAMVAVFHDAVAPGLADRVYEMAAGHAA